MGRCEGTRRMSLSAEGDRSPRMHCSYRLFIHPLCEMAREDRRLSKFRRFRILLLTLVFSTTFCGF